VGLPEDRAVLPDLDLTGSLYLAEDLESSHAGLGLLVGHSAVGHNEATREGEREDVPFVVELRDGGPGVIS
jgi:hypothetical protein